MSADYVSSIDALFESSARALFGAQGVPLAAMASDAREAPGDHDVASSIGFTAPNCHGAVLITTRREIVARAWPPELAHRPPSERDVCDWAGELVNQLLGRVKNALLPFGLVLEQSTPMVVTGRHVHRTPASTAIARRYMFDVDSFAADGGCIAIYLDATLGEGFAVTPSGDDGSRTAAEGDVQFF